MKKAHLFLIAVFYLIFFVATPPFQLPDEPDHFQYVYWLSKGMYPKLPPKGGMKVYDPTVERIYDMLEVASNDYNIPNYAKIREASRRNTPFTTKNTTPPLTYQSHHPPLFHISALIFFIPAFFFSHGNLIITYYATKLISMIFYLFTVYLAWKIGIFLLKKRQIARYLTIVFAINPVTIKMGISINPDIASCAFSLAILYVFLLLGKKTVITKKIIIFLSVLLGTAVLVKFQNISYLLFTLVFFIIRGIQTKKPKHFISYGIMSVLLSLLLVSPWLMYSLMTYHSITPSYIAYRFFCTANLSAIPWYKIPFEVLFEFRHAFYHFAGFLGWGEPAPFKPFFLGYAGAFILFLFMGIYVLTKCISKRWWIFFLHAAMICLFFLGVSITYKLNRYSCDVQGRYLLSSLFSFIICVHAGLSYFMGKEKAARMFMFFSIWQYYFVLCYVLITRYYV